MRRRRSRTAPSVPPPAPHADQQRGGVIGVIARTSDTAASVSTRSRELADQARRLSGEVTQFITALRSGPLDRRKLRAAAMAARNAAAPEASAPPEPH